MKKYTLTFLALILTLIANSSFAQGFILNEEKFFNDEIKVLIPSNFIFADDKLILEKYGNGEQVPKIIYTDNSKRALLSLNMVKNDGNRDTIVKLYKLVKDDIRSKYPGKHKFLKTDVIRNRRLANIEVILPNNEGDMIYNMMAFIYVGTKFVSLNFSCPQEDIEKWQNTAQEIAKNLKMTDGYY